MCLLFFVCFSTRNGKEMVSVDLQPPTEFVDLCENLSGNNFTKGGIVISCGKISVYSIVSCYFEILIDNM